MNIEQMKGKEQQKPTFEIAESFGQYSVEIKDENKPDDPVKERIHNMAYVFALEDAFQNTEISETNPGMYKYPISSIDANSYFSGIVLNVHPAGMTEETRHMIEQMTKNAIEHVDEYELSAQEHVRERLAEEEESQKALRLQEAQQKAQEAQERVEALERHRLAAEAENERQVKSLKERLARKEKDPFDVGLKVREPGDKGYMLIFQEEENEALRDAYNKALTEVAQQRPDLTLFHQINSKYNGIGFEGWEALFKKDAHTGQEMEKLIPLIRKRAEELYRDKNNH